MINSKDMVVLIILMVKYTKENGKMVKCMEKVYLNEVMDSYMMENMIKIKDMVMGYLDDQMEGNIVDIENMEDKMERVRLNFLMESFKKESGRMGKK